MYPTWRFCTCDTEYWSFTENHIGKRFWTEILPFFKSLETQTWNEILVKARDNNHPIQADELSHKAQKRLSQLHIEAESIVSLRVSGTHRVYGYFSEFSFCILWYDDDHGDNNECVCRSRLKHT